MKIIYGIDIGGTNIKLGKFYENKLIFKNQFHTEISKDPNVLVNQIINLIDSNKNEDEEIIGIGIGVPGPVVDGVVIRAQNILWENVKLKKYLEEKFMNSHIAIVNDANAATIGEWYFGNDVIVNNFVLITLGTGVGGGVIINKTLHEGKNGAAGEIGHIKIFPTKGRLCTCGLAGCIEQYANSSGIIKTYRKLNRENLFQKNVNTKTIFDAARTGCKIALQAVDLTTYYLAIALVNISNILNPDLIVIGGGISKAGDVLLNPLKEHFSKIAFYANKNTTIELATLQNDAGMYGAMYKASIGLGLINGI